MSPLLILILSSYFIGLAFVSMDSMKKSSERPPILYGFNFNILSFAFTISGILLVIWSFKDQGFLNTLIFIGVTIFLTPQIVRRVTSKTITDTAIGPLLGVVALVVLNIIAWSK